MKKISKFYLLLSWIFFIFILTISPINKEPNIGIAYFDKFVHLFLFSVLVCLAVNFFTEFLFNYRIVLFISFLASSIYAFLIEYWQIFIPGRFSSESDFFAGMLGSLLATLILFLIKIIKKPKLLLHICCVGCGAYVSRSLKKEYSTTLYFYNPNIYPENEHNKRLNEAKKIAKKFKFKLIIGNYDHDEWLKKIKGYEKEPERGKRCRICYKYRLYKTAQEAHSRGFNYFATTLTMSPHKDDKIINDIGCRMAYKFNINFLNKDFKKKNGFKKSSELSKKLGLYRQNYCGCEFSKRIF